jgi:hypothetical protein
VLRDFADQQKAEHDLYAEAELYAEVDEYWGVPA